MQKTLAELDNVRGGRTATVRTDEQQAFWGFTLNGSTSLEALAQFYGLKAPGMEPGITLGHYLARTSYGSLRAGYRIAVGGAELSILEIDEGMVRRVGLEFPPVTLRQSQRRRPHRQARDIDSRAANWRNAD